MNTSETAVIDLSSITFENMKTELADKIYAMIELAWEGIDLVEQIKEDLGMNRHPNLLSNLTPFEPLENTKSKCLLSLTQPLHHLTTPLTCSSPPPSNSHE